MTRTKPVRPLLLVILLLLFILPFATPVHAQECTPIRFLPGQVVRVTGSLDAGGLPYRGRAGLENAVLGFIPLETILQTEGRSECIDGRNWYGVAQSDLTPDLPPNIYVMDGDGTTPWLEPMPICPYAPGRGIRLDAYGTLRDFASFAPDPTNPDWVILSYNPVGEQVHPALQRHYALDMRTGLLTETDYPHADVVTRRLTDRLGITEYVFGDSSMENYGLRVSPDGSKVLYFVPGPIREDCAHGCRLAEAFIANSDGSNPVSLGNFSLDNSLVDVHWGANDRLYLTLISEFAPSYFTVELCLDGSCGGYITDVLGIEGYAAFVSVSPDGRYRAVERFSIGDGGNGALIFDEEGELVMELPDNGDASLAVIWASENVIYYPLQGGYTVWEGETPQDYDHVRHINLNLQDGTFDPADQLTLWREGMFNGWDRGWIKAGGTFVVYSGQVLSAYCFGRG
ncbi:MAG: hypothetical protein SF029_24340 [bacterium]|nr:hypothetical protein [bacterium]